MNEIFRQHVEQLHGKYEALVQMKLTAFRDKDRTHLRDLIDIGLVDRGWCARLPRELSARLQTLLDNPEG